MRLGEHLCKKDVYAAFLLGTFILRRERSRILSHPAQQVGFPFWMLTLGERAPNGGGPQDHRRLIVGLLSCTGWRTEGDLAAPDSVWSITAFPWGNLRTLPPSPGCSLCQKKREGGDKEGKGCTFP